jgi:hypothetical protein
MHSIRPACTGIWSKWMMPAMPLMARIHAFTTENAPSITSPQLTKQRLDDHPHCMIDTFSGIEAELLQLFRDPAGFAARNLSVADGDELLAAAERHGVAALLAVRLADAPPSPFLDQLRDSARGSAAWEMGHRRALLDALSSLAEAGITPVLFKGTALAYSLYPSPVLRTRGDTDLIVPQHERERVTGVLLRCGFAPLSVAECATASYQTSFRRSRPEGSHVLDVHWQINNSEVLSRLFTYQELRAEAVSLPALAPDALAASPVHALLLACMHRGTHRHNPYYVSGEPHTGGNRLIWLYDLHLLAGSFNERDWRSFIARAQAKGLRAICADGLATAHRCFATNVPDYAFAALERGDVREPASDYLGASPARQLWMDYRALPGPGRKARYLRDLLFPPAEFMRSKFAGEGGQWLPWLYVRRAAAGAWRRLRGRVI